MSGSVRRRTVLAVVALIGAITVPALAGVAPAGAGTASTTSVFRQVAAGVEHSCAVTASGGAMCWGSNASGRLGNGTTTDSRVPVAVTGLPAEVTAIAAGSEHTCALLVTGAVSCWGAGSSGQLGNGSTTASSVPVTVANLSGVTAIDAIALHTCALLGSGGVRCWGGNGDGQLGDGTKDSSSTPVAVSGLTGATAVTAGRKHSCAVVGAGVVRCWGANDAGQLGDGTTTSSTTPTTATALPRVSTVDAGFEHTCALGGGAVRCWGFGGDGQLGNGATTSSSVPVEVSGLAGIRVLALGGDHGCAVRGGGDVSCWGNGISGQLGNGDIGSSSLPVTVSGDGGATSVAAGYRHSCAARIDGGLRCWGWNFAGQLGNGSAAETSAVPVDVAGITLASVRAPGNASAVAGAGQASVSWTAPTGSPVTGYVVTPYIGTSPQTPVAFASTATTQTITGLANGAAYSFAVSAVNGAATGPQSAPTVAVVPSPTADTGFLRVVTSPAVPSQITIDGKIADSWGLEWVKQPVGSHTVCFAAVEGYTAPPCQTVSVTWGQTTTVTGTFVQRGFLRVVTSPAVNSQITVDGVPRNNWGLWTDVPVGSHEVCFGAVAGFTAPPCQTVDLVAGTNPTVTGSFSSSLAGGQTGLGFLRVVTSPARPSQITVDGNIANTWGLDWLQIAPGSHTVCFSHVEGWTEPGCSTVTVTADAITAVTGTFVQRGFLKIGTSPAVAATITVDGVSVDDWGNYTDRPVGTYHVCFGEVPGKITPPCQDPAVTAGTTTEITGTYT